MSTQTDGATSFPIAPYKTLHPIIGIDTRLNLDVGHGAREAIKGKERLSDVDSGCGPSLPLTARLRSLKVREGENDALDSGRIVVAAHSNLGLRI